MIIIMIYNKTKHTGCNRCMLNIEHMFCSLKIFENNVSIVQKFDDLTCNECPFMTLL